MSPDQSQQLHKLLTLLSVADHGVFTVVIYDRLVMRRELIVSLHQQLARPVYEEGLSAENRNPLEAIGRHKPGPGDTVCLYGFEAASPEVFAYLERQREALVETQASLVCFVTPFEYRELAKRAPNFYDFRSSLFDFTSAAIPSGETVFIGRTQELATLQTLLQQGEGVVLTGLGGIGKTALALQATQVTKAHMTGGLVWINCEPRPLLGDILVTCSKALLGEDTRHYRPDEQRQLVETMLHEQRCLLVLDNFDTLAEDMPILRWLRSVAAPSSVLITSREPLPFLNAQTIHLDVLPLLEATELFIQRAYKAGWDGEGVDLVAKLCQVVGGLPLAMYLLAPQTAELPLSTLISRVSQDLDTLSMEEVSDTPDRHKSITACFRLSFERLSEEARALIARLSLLPDGAGPDIVADCVGIAQWHQPIAECIRYSLLEFDNVRYHFHPLVRRYALMQLQDVPKWKRHIVSFFCNFMLKANDNDYPGRLAILDAEWRNIVEAIEFAIEIGDWEAAAGIPSYLGEYLILRGRIEEAERLALLSVKAASNSILIHGIADARNNLAGVYARQERWAEASSYFELNLSFYETINDSQSLCVTLDNLGSVYTQQERWQQAEHMLLRSLGLAKQLHDEHMIARIQGHLGELYGRQNKFQKAEEALVTSSRMLHQLGDVVEEAVALGNLGVVYKKQNRWSEAETAYRQCVDIARRYGDFRSEGNALQNLANLKNSQGYTKVALELLYAAADAYQGSHDLAALLRLQQAIKSIELQMPDATSR
jgi:tetratricopeptide (TPR) repeat protein